MGGRSARLAVPRILPVRASRIKVACNKAPQRKSRRGERIDPYESELNSAKKSSGPNVFSSGRPASTPRLRRKRRSEADGEPFVNKPRDGFNAQQWIGEQVWRDGMIGMYGATPGVGARLNSSTETTKRMSSAPVGRPHPGNET